MAFNYLKMGSRIQSARTACGMSITELAEKSHFTAKSIALVEAGQAEINMPFLTALCTALNVTPNDLLEGEYQVTGIRTAQEDTLLKEMRDILTELKGNQDDGIVYRDTESVVREIREMLHEEKKNEPGMRSSIGNKHGRSNYF